MKRQLLVSGLLAAALLGSFVPTASAETFQKTLTLGPGGGTLNNSDFGIGDTIVLTLINPTNKSMVFETTDNIANNKSWMIPAHSQATVDFTYTQPFSDDVKFVVREVGGPVISQGTFIYAETPVAYPSGTCPPPSRVLERPASYHPNSVRGYW